MRNARWIPPILLTFFGIAASLVIIEITLRVSTYIRGPKHEWNDRPPFYFEAEASPTLQDYPHQPEKPANTFRMAIVGDSFTFAPYMQFTDAFPKVLERMLNLNTTPLHAEVVNYGVPAYSTAHEVAVVARAVKEDADLIVLEITLNDPEIKLYRPTGITVFNKHGELLLTGWKARLAKVWHTYRLVAERLHNQATEREYIRYHDYLFENPKTWNSFEQAMRQIVKITSDSNKKLVAVVFPLFGLPLDDSYPFFSCHKKVEALLDELKVPYLDLFETYRGIPVDRIQVMPAKDTHPNEIAHRMAAEALYTWMVSKKLIPDELKIRKRFQRRTDIIKEKPFVDPQ